MGASCSGDRGRGGKKKSFFWFDSEPDEAEAPPPELDLPKIDYGYLSADARQRARERLPIIGVLQGRLTYDRLMEIWYKYDKEKKGELKTEETVPLVEEIIMLVPKLVRESAEGAMQPVRELGDIYHNDGSHLAQDVANTEKVFEEDIEPLLKGLEIRLRSMKGYRMRKLVDKLIDRLDLNHDGSVDKFEYLATFLPEDGVSNVPAPTATEDELNETTGEPASGETTA